MPSPARGTRPMPSIPSPPAFVTAAARSGPATLDMPASCNGRRQPTRSVKRVMWGGG